MPHRSGPEQQTVNVYNRMKAKAKTVAVAAWILALSAWVVYEQTLQQMPPAPPVPPAAPPPPAGPAPFRDVHSAATEWIGELARDGRDLLWMQGADLEGLGVPTTAPTLLAVATRDRVTRLHKVSFLLRGAPAGEFGFGPAPIAHGMRTDDLTGDGRPEILVPAWGDGWHVYAPAGEAVRELPGRIAGTYPGRPRDVDGDGTVDLVVWDTGGPRAFERWLFWEADPRRFSEERSRPLYEKKARELADFPHHDAADLDAFLYYMEQAGRSPTEAREAARGVGFDIKP